MGLADHGVEEGHRNHGPRRPPATAVQVVAELGEQRDNPWPAVKEVAEHSALGALCGDLCQCLLGVIGSVGCAQGGHEQSVGLQQRAGAPLMLQPLRPGFGAFAGQAGLISKQLTNFGLIAELGGDLAESARRGAGSPARPLEQAAGPAASARCPHGRATGEDQ